ncbi:DUF4870 domain-containing protein [Nocardioides rotundus]|uniref:DUF4870 domain-containing protein n=1 Tax=Nocardioides rotundus TaxID=1774216 RepID=UPI001CBD1973|nr:DUF4870 domain-containing protein [Nocardioides rotundus]UAL28364.1 DUF4870 domain-containing protein [Nocardioides rotundus]
MSQYDYDPESPYREPYGSSSYGYPSYGQQPYDQPYGGYAQPTMSPSEERTWGMLSHLIAIAAMVLSMGLLGFVASLVVYLVYKDRGPFVRAHAANSLNVQLTMLFWLILSLPLILLLGLGLLVMIAAPIVAFVLHLIGAIKASNGEWWDPPLTPRMVR